MNHSVYKERIEVFRKKLPVSQEADPDTAWIIQSENRRYLSGFKALDGQINESSGSLLVNQIHCLLATDSRYVTEAEREAVDFEVKTLKNGLVEDLPGLLTHLGTRNLGFEPEYLTWELHRQLNGKLQALSSPVSFNPLRKVLEEMREVKDNYEIKAMAASAELISAILGKIIEELKPGMSEKEVAWQLEGLARDGGAEDVAFPPIVASGPNSALPHAVPTDRKLKRNEPVLIDTGVRLNGYCSDMTRTVFLGEADADFKRIYKTVREAQLAALREIKPGVESTYPDSVARQIINDAGFGDKFGHALGHGVGLATHEGPRLGPLKAVKLKKGMVVTVEPGIYIPGTGGVRLEEMVVIEEDGPRVLTQDSHFYNF